MKCTLVLLLSKPRIQTLHLESSLRHGQDFTAYKLLFKSRSNAMLCSRGSQQCCLQIEVAGVWV